MCVTLTACMQYTARHTRSLNKHKSRKESMQNVIEMHAPKTKNISLKLGVTISQATQALNMQTKTFDLYVGFFVIYTPILSKSFLEIHKAQSGFCLII